MQTDIDRILDFWLKEVGPKNWYTADPTVDARIRAKFLPLWEQAMEGQLECWFTTPKGALALIILTDQFPRNMFRGRADAYRTDRYALGIAKRAIARGHDRRIDEPERQFFYVPLMHSESLADQDRCLRLFLMRMPATGALNREHGIKHRDVIRRFGRFPSRNPILGRRDTEAERAYRAKGGYMS